MDSRVIEHRRKICSACELKAACPSRHTILEKTPRCPLELLPSYEETLHLFTHPTGIPAVQGCCDSAQPGDF